MGLQGGAPAGSEGRGGAGLLCCLRGSTTLSRQWKVKGEILEVIAERTEPLLNAGQGALDREENRTHIKIYRGDKGRGLVAL